MMPSTMHKLESPILLAVSEMLPHVSMHSMRFDPTKEGGFRKAAQPQETQ